MSVFIDTWGFKAFFDRKEPKHNDVKKYIENLYKTNQKIYTSDYIIDETITLLSLKIDYNKFIEFIYKLEEAIKGDYISLVWVSEQDFEDAKRLKIKYKDKPKISFTDFTTMVLMKNKKITDIISSDKHFEEVGLDLNVLFK